MQSELNASKMEVRKLFGVGSFLTFLGNSNFECSFFFDFTGGDTGLELIGTLTIGLE
jgi:hypothetical protein